MASSVNRRIESDLLWVKGQRDPVSLIRSRSTFPIRACGLGRANKAGHMTASDHRATRANKSLASRGPSTHDPQRNSGQWTPRRSADTIFRLPLWKKGGGWLKNAFNVALLPFWLSMWLAI